MSEYKFKYKLPDQNQVASHIVIKGDKGDKGDRGERGLKGDKGEQGDPGLGSFVYEKVDELPNEGVGSKLYLVEKDHAIATATGNPIEVNVTNEDAVEDAKMLGNTEQQSYTGKNLWSTTTLINGFYAFANGAYNVGNDKYVTSPQKIDVVAGETYTISADKGADIAGSGCVFFSGDTFVSSAVNPANGTFTVPAGANKMAFNFFDSTGLSPSEVTHVQLEAGSTATEYEQFVGGSPAPNTDFPQNIHVVTGAQKIRIRGKNILEERVGFIPSINGLTSVINDDGSITTTGKPVENWKGILNRDLTDELVDGATYTLSQGVPGQQASLNSKLYVQVSAYNYETQYTTYYSLDRAASKTFTVNKSLYKYALAITCPGPSTWGNETLTITQWYQLEKGSSATAYEKTHHQEFEVNLGKNLFNRDAITEGAYINSSGAEVSNNSFAISEYIPVEPNASYTYSGSTNTGTNGAKAAWYDKNKNWISSIDYDHFGTITAPANARYFRTSVRLAVGDAETYQFEKGNVATTYAAYFTPIELCKLGNFQDFIYKSGNDWKVHKATNKINVDGSENWQFPDSGENHTFFQFSRASFRNKYGNNADFYASNTEVGFAKADKFEQIVAAAANMRTKQGIGFSSEGSGWLRISVANTIATTVEAFTAWLAENVTTLYYALATPIDTVITNTSLIAELEELDEITMERGLNIITVTAADANLPADLELTYDIYDSEERFDKFIWFDGWERI